MQIFRRLALGLSISLLLLVLLAGCNGSRPLNDLKDVFRKQTAYERYADAIQKSGNYGNQGQAWVTIGQEVLFDTLKLQAPFMETAAYTAEHVTAASYTLELLRGEHLEIGLQTEGQEAGHVFADLFLAEGHPTEYKAVASTDTNTSQIEYTPKESGTFILRVQPELQKSGKFTLTVRTSPTLVFPVQGKDSRHIASFWGYPRDGGKRKHEGIDIFAKRGTPAIASVHGYVTRVGENRLGGNVVWIADARNSQTLYYAHLDKQLVQPGQRVIPGDTIGLIGNTGNAKTTAPHLHFGIYRHGRGAVDPFPYVRKADEPGTITADLARLGSQGRVMANKAMLRSGPTVKASAVGELPRHTSLQVVSGNGGWYRVVAPDGTRAYMSAKLVETADKPIEKKKISKPTELLARPYTGAELKDSLPAASTVAVLAYWDNYLYVSTPDNLTGWIIQ
jgi:peptidoglycan LD-endopeptidase LytH